MASSDNRGPNPLRAAWSLVWALRVRPPSPRGSTSLDHDLLAPILDGLEGPASLSGIDPADLDGYLEFVTAFDPDELTAQGALAYWINVYNACSIRLAVNARRDGATSVLRVPGAFDAKDVIVAGESLSLNDIEHGKIRRFADPRIHGALVCGSLSCPTLRRDPFTAEGLADQLDSQMRHFLAAGGAHVDRDANTVHLSRIFLWYGADFVRPRRMPVFVPAPRRAIAAAVTDWMDDELAQWVRSANPDVHFQSYDWGLGCSVS